MLTVEPTPPPHTPKVLVYKSIPCFGIVYYSEQKCLDWVDNGPAYFLLVVLQRWWDSANHLHPAPPPASCSPPQRKVPPKICLTGPIFTKRLGSGPTCSCHLIHCMIQTQKLILNRHTYTALYEYDPEGAKQGSSTQGPSCLRFSSVWKMQALRKVSFATDLGLTRHKMHNCCHFKHFIFFLSPQMAPVLAWEF